MTINTYTVLICEEDVYTLNMYEQDYPHGINLVSVNAMGEVMDTPLHR